MNRSLFSAFALLVAPLAHGQFPISVSPRPTRHSQDYPLQDPFRYADAGRVTALSIVECLAPGHAEGRTYVGAGQDAQGIAPGATRQNAWVETVRVVDSIALSRGATARVVVQEDPEVAYPMVPGHRYLVLASLPLDGRLEFPALGRFESGTYRTPAAKNEVAGLAAFETHAAALDGSPDPAERIAASVIDCVPGGDREGVQRVAQWLEITGYPGGGNYSNPFGRETFPLATRIRDVARDESAYTRFKLFQVLCQWHVFGSEQGWVDAILDLAPEADPFLPGDDGLFTFDFSYARMSHDPKYIPFRLDGNRWADTVVAARTDAVRGLLLFKVSRNPDEAHERRMDDFLLASSNEAILYLAADRIARILKRPDLAPKRQYIDGRRIWTNREASLASLRARYGLVPATKP